MSGSVYFFPKVCFQVLFRYIKDPVFISLEQFLGEFKRFFFFFRNCVELFVSFVDASLRFLLLQ